MFTVWWIIDRGNKSWKKGFVFVVRIKSIFDISLRFQFYYFYLIVRIYFLVPLFFFFFLSLKLLFLFHRVKFFFDFRDPIFLRTRINFFFPLLFADDFFPFHFYLFRFAGIIFSLLPSLNVPPPLFLRPCNFRLFRIKISSWF